MSCICTCMVRFFFFKQKTAYEMRISDWSSDVCSSDLPRARLAAVFGLVHAPQHEPARRRRGGIEHIALDRKSVVSGKSVSVRVDRGGRRIIKTKIYNRN